MSEGRRTVLSSIARSQPKPNLIPRRAADLPQSERIALFATMARGADATLAELPSVEAAPAAIADYLRRENLPSELRIAPEPVLEKLAWSALPLLSVSYGRATGAETVSVTSAFAGIAETGTLMLTSSPTMPTTLNFLPDTNIVLLRAERIVGVYEEGWALLRQTGAMPRTVNFITGPSRSADIEQTLLLGAHGPRRLHILLIHAGPAD
jgi:L-lactate dehydrogenase complex protein LldG